MVFNSSFRMNFGWFLEATIDLYDRSGFQSIRARRLRHQLNTKTTKKYDVWLTSNSNLFIWPLWSKNVKTEQLDEAVSWLFLTILRKAVVESGTKWSQLYVCDCCFTKYALIMSQIVTWTSVICVLYFKKSQAFYPIYYLLSLFYFKLAF